MASLNKVLLVGNLTRDPKTRPLGSSGEVCEFGLATNRRYRTAAGEDREDTCFVDIEVFGRSAGLCAENLRRGSTVYVEGRLHTNQWTDKTTGQNRSRLTVVAETVQFLERLAGRQEDPEDEDRGSRRTERRNPGRSRNVRETEPPYGQTDDVGDVSDYAEESIPF